MKNSGIGFVGTLTILFIALKLTHVISWSWLWVLSPIGFYFIWIIIAAFIIIKLNGGINK